MSPELELRAEKAGPSVEQQIRDLFAALGGSMSMAELARALVEHGVCSDEELRSLGYVALQAKCRRALKVLDAGGLPENGPTAQRDEDGAPVWKSRQIWLFPDYEINISELVGNRNENHYGAIKLAEECEVRFGHAPEISPLEGRRS